MHSRASAKDAIETLSEMVTITGVQPEDIQAALTSPVEDFEDALVDAVAKRYNAICTLTRNARDFKGAKVTAMEPGEYIRKFFAE